MSSRFELPFARIGPAFCVMFSVAVAASAQSGTLQLGAYGVNGRTLSMPIALEIAGATGVSAMDFRVTYDPAVFEPISLRAGAAASQADKLITGNVAAPGQYVVLMFGMNQTTLSAGEIATIDFRVLDAPSTGSTEITLGGTTLSSPDALDIPSRGSRSTVPFDGDLPVTPESDEAAEASKETLEVEDLSAGAAESGPTAIPSLPQEREGRRPGPGASTGFGRRAGAFESDTGPSRQPANNSIDTAPTDSSPRVGQVKDIMSKIQEADRLRALLPAVGRGGGLLEPSPGISDASASPVSMAMASRETPDLAAAGVGGDARVSTGDNSASETAPAALGVDSSESQPVASAPLSQRRPLWVAAIVAGGLLAGLLLIRRRFVG